jgi:small nuclear ribonucleoprotein (snRNP)-like protein
MNSNKQDKELQFSNASSVQPPQHFLELIGRLYKKRDGILESSQKLVDYTYKLEDCDNNELRGILARINKEMNLIVSNAHELAPHLADSHIVEAISKQVRLISLIVEQTGLSPKYYKGILATYIRTTICQDANKTQLKPTPKSIKQAFGITVSPHDIKLLFEHHQDNY